MTLFNVGGSRKVMFFLLCLPDSLSVQLCQGAITTGYASAATDDAIQADIVRVYRSASLKNYDQ
jgi:hypothetical protein